MATNLLDLLDYMQGRVDAGAAERKKSQLAQLASQAYTAPQGQRQGLVGQAIGVDPQSGFTLDKSLQDGDDARMKRVGQMAGMLVSMPPQARAQAYPGIVQELHTLGLGDGLPPTWSEDLVPYAEKLAQSLGGLGGKPAQQQYAEWLLSHAPADQRDQVLGVLGGYKARPSGAGITYKDGEDEFGNPITRAFDPNNVGGTVLGTGQSYGAPVGTGMRGGQQAPQQAPQPVWAQNGATYQTPSGIVRINGVDPEDLPSVQADITSGGASNYYRLPRSNSGGFMGRRKEDEAAAVEAAKQRVQLQYAPQVAQADASRAGMVTTAQEGAKARSEAQTSLPKVESAANLMLDTISKLKAHKGLPTILGLQGKFNPNAYIPGTPAQGAKALADQIQGQTFLHAYNQLRGGGQITEAEGQKAEAAMARLNRAQSYEDYVSALNDLETVINNAVTSAKQSAGQQPQQPAGGPAASGGPKPGTVDGGYRFKGGNPADQNNWERI